MREFEVPISGTAFIIITLTLRLATTKTPVLLGIKTIDWLGSLTITGSTVMFLLGLQFGGTTFPWDSPTVICLVVFGVVAAIVFGVVERYFARYPIVPLHLYTNVSNLAILLVVFFHGLAFTQGTYFLPLYFQAVLGAEPLRSGVWLLPYVLSLSVSAMAAGIYLKTTGRYLDCIRLGFVLTVLGCGLFYDLPDSRSWAKIILYQIVSGIGVGANFQPPLVALQSSVSAQHNAAATASFALMRNVATAISVVIGSVAFSNKMSAQQNMLRSELGDTVASLLLGNNAQANLFMVHTLDAPQQRVIRDAFYKSVRVIWVETVCFAATGLLACLFIGDKKLDTAHVEVKTGLEGEEARRKIALEERTKNILRGEKLAG